MKILSIDTSSKVCTVAILEDNKLIKEIWDNNGYTHSERLMPTIKQILEETDLELKDIDLFVVDKGPGSFTGIRIGIATMKGFFDYLNTPSIGVSSLEALAYNIKENGIICSLIDAKNEQVYSGIFENIDGKYIIRRNLSFDNIHDFLDDLKNLNLDYNITFVGDGAILNKELIIHALPNSKFINNNDVSAYNLGLAGLYRYNEDSNIVKNEDNILPLYLRKSEAEINFEKNHS